MRDFGYDNFEKNNVVITKFKQQGKLDSLAEMAGELEKSYNGGGGQSSMAQPAAAAQA